MINGLGVDEHLAALGAGGEHYFAVDGINSTVALTDGSGQATSRYAYDPYGTVQATGEDGESLLYTGRERDLADLYFYRARYYSPVSGRFVSSDPLGFGAGQLNFYAYVGGDPFSYIDPMGLADCTMTYHADRSATVHCISNNPGNAPVDIPVASGNNGGGSQCKNNPACQGDIGRGPIPVGDWHWTNGTTSKPNGRVLEPNEGTDARGRTNIRSHSCRNAFGPSAQGPYCSEGCVTGQAADIQRMNTLLDAEPNSQLHVVIEQNGGY